LKQFEEYINVNGLRIGGWELMVGNGEHFFIRNVKRDGFYRFDKTHLQKMVQGEPSKYPVNDKYAAGIGCGPRDIF
jgi:hypothetical protein